jgi:hypothetical protein
MSASRQDIRSLSANGRAAKVEPCERARERARGRASSRWRFRCCGLPVAGSAKEGILKRPERRRPGEQAGAMEGAPRPAGVRRSSRVQRLRGRAEAHSCRSDDAARFSRALAGEILARRTLRAFADVVAGSTSDELTASATHRRCAEAPRAARSRLR